jgi:RNA polymerase-binding transcription factor DksA
MDTTRNDTSNRVTEPPNAAAGTAVRERLDAERLRIETLIAGITGDLSGTGLHDEMMSERTGEIASSGQHPADVASELFEREREVGLLDDLRAMLVEVDEALVRVARGTYGTCVDCRVEIGAERLGALPAAAYCLHCQERHEFEGPATETGTPWLPTLGEGIEFLSTDDELAMIDDELPMPDQDRSVEEQAMHLDPASGD